MEKEIEFIKNNYDIINDVITIILVPVLIIVLKKRYPIFLIFLLVGILGFHIIMFPDKNTKLLYILGILVFFRYIIMNEWNKGIFTIDLWNIPYWGIELLFLNKYTKML